MFAAAQVYDFPASTDGQIDMVSDANTITNKTVAPLKNCVSW